MPTRGGRKTGNPTRPIRSGRDYEGAKRVVRRIAGQAGLDSTAELRLKALLEELDKYEEPEDDGGGDTAEDAGYAGPRRRWSDDASGGENS
jgi:hypothetical protein